MGSLRQEYCLEWKPRLDYRVVVAPPRKRPGNRTDISVFLFYSVIEEGRLLKKNRNIHEFLGLFKNLEGKNGNLPIKIN